ncbi:MAG: LamG-like jellyroll fold domain-containing protein, partial [Verrucomicrobiota bacterium]
MRLTETPFFGTSVLFMVLSMATPRAMAGAAPVVLNDTGATAIGTGTALLHGALSGNTSIVTTIYWGTSDGGTVKTNWAHAVQLGPRSLGPFTNAVSNLTPDTLYYYRCYASNAVDEAWAPATTNFRTHFDPTAYGSRMKIAFTGYTANTTLTNFPALVILSTNIPGFRYEDFCGGDLRFTGTNVSRTLNYEIETWNPDGESHVWVQVPELRPSNTCIFAWWASPGQTDPDYALNGAAWESGFQAVYHLNENFREGAGGFHADATANGLDGAQRGNHSVPGVVGRGQEFDGFGDVISTPVVTDQTGAFGLTFSAWVQPHTADGNFERLFDADKGGWDWSLVLDQAGGGNWEVFWGANQQGSGHTADIDAWQHIAAVFDPASTNVRVYKNGVETIIPNLDFDGATEAVDIG